MSLKVYDLQVGYLSIDLYAAPEIAATAAGHMFACPPALADWEAEGSMWTYELSDPDDNDLSYTLYILPRSILMRARVLPEVRVRNMIRRTQAASEVHP